jgi:hypothetical protein
MPLFFLLPLWLLCILGAAILLLFRKYRYLAAYLALCSTGALIGCCTLGIFALLVISKMSEQSSTAMAIGILIVLVGAGVLGGILGCVAGFLLARWVNRVLGWATSLSV